MGVNSWALMDDSPFTIDGVMPPFWPYPDPTEELQKKLLYTTEEFKSFQLHANEKIKKQGENIDQLIQVVKITLQERDEAINQLQIAKNQIQILQNKLMPPTPTHHFPLPTNCLQPESPQMRQAMNSSGITESDSISDTHNHQSYVSSPVESFFNAATSPDQIVVPHQLSFQEYENKSCSSSGVQKYDLDYARIERLFTKKPLPEKGNLMAAIKEAGPLLKNLLIAGSLPQWINPPKPMQPLTIPPIPIKGLVSKSSNRFQNSPIGPQMNASNGDLYYSTVAEGNAGLDFVGSYEGLNAKRQRNH